MASKKNHQLDERKKKILKAVTDDYILSAEPVGSRTVAKRYELGLSSATIRNEMADLEESGYLEQPHASAGRVPSDLGYRYYVDALMSMRQLSPVDIDLIYSQMDLHQQELEILIHKTAKILGQITKYPSIVLAPQIQTALFRHIQLVKLAPKTILLLIVTDTGYVENKIIDFEGEISSEELDHLSIILNKKLRGISLKDLNTIVLNELHSEMVLHDHFYNESIKVLIKAMTNKTNERVFVDGATKILEQPEFNDIQKFKTLMNLLEEEERLYKLLANNSKQTAQVKIGHENNDEEIHDCSVVTSSYEIAGRTVGVIGILGPTRMEYARILPIVEYTAAVLSELLTQISKRGHGRIDSS